MNLKISLINKIRIVFAFLFLFTILSYIPTLFMDEKKDHEKVMHSYERIMLYPREDRLPRHELIKYMNNLNFSEVKNHNEIFKNTQHPIIRRHGFEILKNDNNYYIHVLTPGFKILFLDKSRKYERSYISSFIFMFIAILFAFIYYLIIKNIKDNEHQLKSRQLFLRTVMHELKTPIAKGRIVSELIEDEKQKNRIITVFEKLNFLIDDFAKVEQIVSKNYAPNRYKHSIQCVLKNSIDMLMLENTQNIKLENISTRKINIDMDLFCMAVKNLIDNALKYSTDTQVKISEKSNEILFTSNGQRLKKPLQEYYKPFHNDTKQKNHGMGLGLYIVHSILQMHDMKLDYEFKENQNVFSIKF